MWISKDKYNKLVERIEKLEHGNIQVRIPLVPSYPFSGPAAIISFTDLVYDFKRRHAYKWGEAGRWVDNDTPRASHVK